MSLLPYLYGAGFECAREYISSDFTPCLVLEKSIPPTCRLLEYDTAATILDEMDTDLPPDGPADEGYPDRRIPLARHVATNPEGPSIPEWSDGPDRPLGGTGDSAHSLRPGSAAVQWGVIAPHPLNDQLRPLARPLFMGLARQTNDRDRFATVTRGELWYAAGTFVRYRSNSLAAIRQADRDARRTFATDLVELGRMSPPETHLVMQLLTHIAPHPQESPVGLRRTYGA